MVKQMTYLKEYPSKVRTDLSSKPGHPGAGSRMWKVIVTVKEIKGKCDAGHKVGDKIEFIGDNIINGEPRCILGIAAIWPLLHTMAFGGVLSNSSPLRKDDDTWIACCPDPNNLVIYEMKRTDVFERTPESMGAFVPFKE